MESIDTTYPDEDKTRVYLQTIAKYYRDEVTSGNLPPIDALLHVSKITSDPLLAFDVDEAICDLATGCKIPNHSNFNVAELKNMLASHLNSISDKFIAYEVDADRVCSAFCDTIKALCVDHEDFTAAAASWRFSQMLQCKIPQIAAQAETIYALIDVLRTKTNIIKAEILANKRLKSSD